MLAGLRLGQTTLIRDEAGAGLVVEWDDDDDDDDDGELNWGEDEGVDYFDSDGAVSGEDADVAHAHDDDDDDDAFNSDNDDDDDDDDDGDDDDYYDDDDDDDDDGDDDDDDDNDDDDDHHHHHDENSDIALASFSHPDRAEESHTAPILAADLVEPGDTFLAAAGGGGGRGNTGGSPLTRVTEKEDPRSQGLPGQEQR